MQRVENLLSQRIFSLCVKSALRIKCHEVSGNVNAFKNAVLAIHHGAKHGVNCITVYFHHCINFHCSCIIVPICLHSKTILLSHKENQTSIDIFEREATDWLNDLFGFV